MSAGDTNVTIANQALASVGTRTTITSLSDQTNEAIQVNLIFNDVRDALLRMAPWDCAFNYNNLVLVTATPGTPENPSVSSQQWSKIFPAPPWAYEYVYPLDCLRACWIVPQYQTGFASGVPITTAVTGGAPSFWTGPPPRFKVVLDQPQTITAVTSIASAGVGYAIGDNISLTGGVGVFGILSVTGVNGSGGITSAGIFMGGSYSTQPSNPVSQSGTTGSGSGATFNLTISSAVDRRVILTNQEYAILAYVKQNQDPSLWDTLFTQAMISALAAKLIQVLTGDKGLANQKLAEANRAIAEARVADGNEGLTINDVTPDWIRTRGINCTGDSAWTPNLGYDWGSMLASY